MTFLQQKYGLSVGVNLTKFQLQQNRSQLNMVVRLNHEF